MSPYHFFFIMKQIMIHFVIVTFGATLNIMLYTYQTFYMTFSYFLN